MNLVWKPLRLLPELGRIPRRKVYSAWQTTANICPRTSWSRNHNARVRQWHLTLKTCCGFATGLTPTWLKQRNCLAWWKAWPKARSYFWLWRRMEMCPSFYCILQAFRGGAMVPSGQVAHPKATQRCLLFIAHSSWRSWPPQFKMERPPQRAITITVITKMLLNSTQIVEPNLQALFHTRGGLHKQMCQYMGPLPYFYTLTSTMQYVGGICWYFYHWRCYVNSLSLGTNRMVDQTGWSTGWHIPLITWWSSQAPLWTDEPNKKILSMSSVWRDFTLTWKRPQHASYHPFSSNGQDGLSIHKGAVLQWRTWCGRYKCWSWNEHCMRSSPKLVRVAFKENDSAYFHLDSATFPDPVPYPVSVQTTYGNLGSFVPRICHIWLCG